MNGQDVYQKTNVGAAFIRGVEADAEVTLAPALSVKGSTTSTYGHVPARDEPLRRIPPLNGYVAARVQPEGRWWAEASLRFAARQDRLASGDRSDHRIPAGGTPGWHVVNVYVGVRVSERLELVGAVQNLANRAYRTHGSGIDGVGRSAWIGMSVR